MLSKILSLLTLVLCLSNCAIKKGQDGLGGTTALFNGKDLTGWEIYGTEKWYVEDGNLVCESGPDKQYGYLATNNNSKTLT